jgi:hypothetical protein
MDSTHARSKTMTPEDVTVEKKKLIAILRAELRERQRFERIEFEEKILKPELAEFDKAVTEGRLPTFDFEDLEAFLGVKVVYPKVK